MEKDPKKDDWTKHIHNVPATAWKELPYRSRLPPFQHEEFDERLAIILADAGNPNDPSIVQAAEDAVRKIFERRQWHHWAKLNGEIVRTWGKDNTAAEWAEIMTWVDEVLGPVREK